MQYVWLEYDRLFFNVGVYKHRMALSLRPFFADANNRAAQAHQRAYVHVVGLGLGVWKLHSYQSTWFVQTALEILASGEYGHIGVVDFSYFGNALKDFQLDENGRLPGTLITIVSSKR